mmetsp:Transcript_5946/g.9982  ORF Transcript_5946/g.9982 Transcript_5946/m.9982 type:complete len:104 (-) Transcript_5946:40-351(-)
MSLESIKRSSTRIITQHRVHVVETCSLEEDHVPLRMSQLATAASRFLHRPYRSALIRGKEAARTSSEFSCSMLISILIHALSFFFVIATIELHIHKTFEQGLI